MSDLAQARIMQHKRQMESSIVLHIDDLTPQREGRADKQFAQIAVEMKSSNVVSQRVSRKRDTVCY